MIKRNGEMTGQQKESAVEVSPGLFRMSDEGLEKLPCRPLAAGEVFVTYHELRHSLPENK
jgi:hypothetical protein